MQNSLQQINIMVQRIAYFLQCWAVFSEVDPDLEAGWGCCHGVYRLKV